MTENSLLVCLGNLLNQPVQFNSNDLRFNGKKIGGFNVYRYIDSMSQE
eukprot:CAMPEP_0202969076 /NCGR_PEP_ID=MMETSP1396-20130829/14668_1 /ASSEMBLY_ACC=CAM_ASM_000872 /TAXON_ID= /ORGANISM="Pseudokeronopsis sp., Strain Brazil" /LENGTH=47 /DNA_ID= /DNA_START= /DNA_END= /DNA_ORIENTATION=